MFFCAPVGVLTQPSSCSAFSGCGFGIAGVRCSVSHDKVDMPRREHFRA
jgi:hypothetical protein